MENFYSRVESLLVQNNERQIDLVKGTGIGGGTVRGWRERIPSVENAYKVAQFFNITVEELITGNKPEAIMLKPEEKELLNLYKKFDDRDKKEMLELMRLKASHYNS